ncbi:hypothetical protein CmeUKMEL1_08095 [Cryptosporidium meleagridis]|uniref:Integral membrane protein n=1 Tax=Cryptosporidium meleagridis TaxID=93969 RepID=A0A2P4Z0J2_9CRYT|nr:hypothetical protein CmeUKMEL1_08095 [Cryptosporidium meleagridis]
MISFIIPIRVLLLIFSLYVCSFNVKDVNLKCAHIDDVSVLHLKADYLNVEGCNGFEGAESQEPLSSFEEYLRLSKIQFDHSEEEEKEEEKKTEIMSCRSIDELFANACETKSVLLYKVENYDNLKLGQNCENFLFELVTMCKQARYLRLPLCDRIVKSHKNVKQMKKNYDNYSKKLHTLNDKFLQIYSKIHFYKMSCNISILIESEIKEQALELIREIRGVSNLNRILAKFTNFSYAHCHPLVIYKFKDKLLSYRPRVHFKKGTKFTTQEFSGKMYSTIPNEAYPLKAKSRNNPEASDSGESLHCSSFSSKSSRDYMNPTISYINKMKSKRARASNSQKKV